MATVQVSWIDGEGAGQGPAPLAHVIAWRDQGYFTNSLRVKIDGGDAY